MTKTNTFIIGAIGIVVGLIIGYGVFHSVNLVAGTGAPSGTTNSTPRMVQTVASNTSTTTYASFFNGDTYDRVVTGIEYFATGYGSSPFSTLQAATSTGTSGIGTNYLINFSGISTTTDPVYIIASQTSTSASSTYSIASNGYRIWAAGTYLNFVANATSSGYVTVRVNYLAE